MSTLLINRLMREQGNPKSYYRKRSTQLNAREFEQLQEELDTLPKWAGATVEASFSAGTWTVKLALAISDEALVLSGAYAGEQTETNR